MLCAPSFVSEVDVGDVAVALVSLPGAIGETRFGRRALHLGAERGVASGRVSTLALGVGRDSSAAAGAGSGAVGGIRASLGSAAVLGSAGDGVGDRTMNSVNAAAIAAAPSAAHSTTRREFRSSARCSVDRSVSSASHCSRAAAGSAASASAVVGASELGIPAGITSPADRSSVDSTSGSTVGAGADSMNDSAFAATNSSVTGSLSTTGSMNAGGGRELAAKRSCGTSSIADQSCMPMRQTSDRSDSRPLRRASITSSVVIGTTTSSETLTNHSPWLARFDARLSTEEPTRRTIAKSRTIATRCRKSRNFRGVAARRVPSWVATHAMLRR